MAAPTCTATNPDPAKISADRLSEQVREVASGSSILAQEIPGARVLCQGLLSMTSLVDTAQGNKEELTCLLMLCDVATTKVLEDHYCREPSVLLKDLALLKKCIERAKEVAVLCNKKGLLSMLMIRKRKKIRRDIAAVEAELVSLPK